MPQERPKIRWDLAGLLLVLGLQELARVPLLQRPWLPDQVALPSRDAAPSAGGTEADVPPEPVREFRPRPPASPGDWVRLPRAAPRDG